MSQVCIFFAPGLEEIEGLTVVDLMRRAGISIQVVSVADTLDITGAHNIHITADALLSDTDFSDTEMLVLPGGYPGFEKELRGADVVTDAAVVDGHVITSRGLGTAIEFAAALIALLKDEETAKNIKDEVMYTER